jgi:hypothetical protein
MLLHYTEALSQWKHTALTLAIDAWQPYKHWALSNALLRGKFYFVKVKRTVEGAVYRCTVGDGGIVFVTPAQLSLLLFTAAAAAVELLLVRLLQPATFVVALSTVSKAVAQPLDCCCCCCCSAAMWALFLSSNLMLRTSRRCRVEEARDFEFSIGAAMLSSSWICYSRERFRCESFSRECFMSASEP